LRSRSSASSRMSMRSGPTRRTISSSTS
jgi:hypothetical protein